REDQIDGVVFVQFLGHLSYLFSNPDGLIAYLIGYRHQNQACFPDDLLVGLQFSDHHPGFAIKADLSLLKPPEENLPEDVLKNNHFCEE
ncbi:hypothetical protein ABTL95_19900, partial [Acinetobacter baumannii]